jgi:hypothetical protein
MFKISKKSKVGKYPCPVCGYGLDYPADDFNICPSCGVEFGYETAGRSYHELRQEWVDRGAIWASRVITKPRSWNPYLQMNAARLWYATPFLIQKIQTPNVKEQEEPMVILSPNWNVRDGARLSIVIT